MIIVVVIMIIILAIVIAMMYNLLEQHKILGSTARAVAGGGAPEVPAATLRATGSRSSDDAKSTQLKTVRHRLVQQRLGVVLGLCS